MTNLTPNPGWSDVPQVETTTQLLGGAGGPLNAQAQALLNRTAALQDATDPAKGAALVGAQDGVSGSLWTTVAGFISNVISSAGAAAIGFMQMGTGAIGRSVAEKLQESVSVFEFMTSAQRTNVKARLGTIDVTAAVQAALNAHARVYFPAGVYLVSAPILVATQQQLVGHSPAGNRGVVFLASASVTWPADRGVIETKNFSWTPNSGQGTKPDYWFWGLIDGFYVDANNVADYGVVVWAVGEEAVVRRTSAWRARKANIFYGGYMAVGHIEASSAWYSTAGYGLKMSDHPDPNFAPGISSADGGRGNGGSIRLVGFSGDQNALGHIFADGSQIVELIGLKSEYNNPCVVIDGTGADVDRQRWMITGFRSEHGTTAPSRSFFKIQGSAKPQVFIGSGSAYNSINMIEDAVVGTNVASTGDQGHFVFYDPYQVSDYTVRTTRFGPNVRQYGGPLDLASEYRLTAQNLSTSAYSLALRASFSGTNTFQMIINANNNRYVFLNINNANANGGIQFNGWDGVSTMVPLITFDGARGISIGMSAGSDKLGFLGAAPITKPSVTGSRAGNAALASLLTKLATLGLITDGTSA